MALAASPRALPNAPRSFKCSPAGRLLGCRVHATTGPDYPENVAADFAIFHAGGTSAAAKHPKPISQDRTLRRAYRRKSTDRVFPIATPRDQQARQRLLNSSVNGRERLYFVR